MRDADLLLDYLKNGSEAAFTELVKRYVNLVYATARRHVGDAHSAEEIAQSVFCLLARKAGGLTTKRTLAGWLYLATCFKAAKVVRTEQRRRRREKEAAEMYQHNFKAEEMWEVLSPALDEGLNQLGEKDRLAVLLRFFQRKPMREVGEALGISEAAAKMRVGRAVEQLRQFFVRRGIACSSAALTVLLAEKTAQAAPEAMSAIISKAVLSGGVASATSTTALIRILTLMAKTRATILTGAVIAALLLAVKLQSAKPRSPQKQIAESTQNSTASRAQTSAYSATSDRAAMLKRKTQEESPEQMRMEEARQALHAALHIQTKHFEPAYDEIKRALAKFGDNRKAAFDLLVKEIRDSTDNGIHSQKEWHDIYRHSDPTIALRMNKDAAVLGGALWAVGQIGKSVPEAASYLWEVIDSSTSPVWDKSSALGALHAIGFTATDLPDLTRILSNPDRVFAARCISELLEQDPAGTAAYVPAIQELLDAPDQNTRTFAALALLQHSGTQDPRIAGEIQKLFTGPDNDQNRVSRTWALTALKQAGPAAKSLIPDLLDYASAEPDIGAVTEAYATIATINPAVAQLDPQVALALEEQTSSERWAQKWKSGSYTYDDLLAALKSPAQALTAATHLGEMGSSAQDAVPSMLAALEGKDEDTRDKILEDIQKIDPQVTVSKVSADTLMVGWAYADGVFATRPMTRVDELLDSLMTRDQLRGWFTREELAHYVAQLAVFDPAASKAFVTGVLSKDPSLKSVLQTTGGAQ